MKKVKLGDKIFKPFISTPHIEESTRGIAAALNEKFKDETEPVIFLVVLNGAIPFASSLFTKLKFPVLFDTVKVSSYDGTGRGNIKFKKRPDNDIKDKKVIIVEDIIDTGQTIDYLKMYLKGQGAKDITTSSLLIKPDVYKKYHQNFTQWGLLSGEYKEEMLIGMSVGDEFVVGYGLDYNGLGRNLNKIYVLDK